MLIAQLQLFQRTIAGQGISDGMIKTGVHPAARRPTYTCASKHLKLIIRTCTISEIRSLDLYSVASLSLVFSLSKHSNSNVTVLFI